MKSIFSGFNHNREWGDFQTPPGLALRACQYLAATGVAPTVVIEPTFGEGNFVIAALKTFPTIKLIYGVETQEKYVRHLERTIRESKLDRAYSAEIQLHHDNIFTHRFSEMVAQTESILVLGNPPWVTNAELGALSSRNLPKKRNLKLLNGIDALTGKSNFDISESIILRLLDLFSSYRGTLAMLCKTAIARNIVQIFREKNYRVASLRALKIDAPSEFGAAVDACLFVMELGAANAERICRVASLENPANVMRVYGWSQDKFVSDVNRYLKNCELDGESPLVWRQGIKHDGASVMELNVENEETRNGLGDVVQVEEENLYWLFKSSDLRTFNAGPPTKKIIVTQTRIGQSTAHLKTTAPKLWRYLQKHAEQFEKRKSSIYRSKPRFSIFGIGDYSFTLYKVAISGFYKEPNF
ncbi:MAG: SAM-dependent DNA methyltransferase, partial [Chloroflexi bacterium]|nr:SAM-dependent DNA methyltransferase [Chloroflexota bacterium]